MCSKVGDSTWGGWSCPTPDESLFTDLVGQGWKIRALVPFRLHHPGCSHSSFPPSGMVLVTAVRKCTQGWVGSRGSTDTMLAVVRKPPESIQMPLSLSLRMPIITSAVIPPAGRTQVGPRGQKGALRLQVSPEAVGGGGSRALRCPLLLTLLLLQQLRPARKRALAALHLAGLRSREDLGKVKGALPVPPALGRRRAGAPGCSAEIDLVSAGWRCCGLLSPEEMEIRSYILGKPVCMSTPTRRCEDTVSEENKTTLVEGTDDSHTNKESRQLQEHHHEGTSLCIRRR